MVCPPMKGTVDAAALVLGSTRPYQRRPSHRRRMHNRWRRAALTRRRRRRRRVRVPAAAPKWPRQVRAATPRGRSPARPHTRRPRRNPSARPAGWLGRSRPGAFKPAACLPSTPTASTPACDAGKPPSARASSKAPTTVMPRASATSIKAPSRRSAGPLRLRLTIWAPCSMGPACSALASVVLLHSVDPASCCQQARSASSRARGATPTMPMPLSARAAISPATAVPCTPAATPAALDEVLAPCHLSGEIGMTHVDTAVDDGDANAVPAGPLMQFGQVPRVGSGLQGKQRIVVRWCRGERMEQLHRLDPRNATVARQPFGDLCQRSFRGQLHDKAVQPQQRHRPAVLECQTVLSREPPRQALATQILPRPGLDLDHDEQLPSQVGWVRIVIGARTCAEDGQPDHQRPGSKVTFHGATPAASSDSARITVGRSRRRASAARAWPCWH